MTSQMYNLPRHAENNYQSKSTKEDETNGLQLGILNDLLTYNLRRAQSRLYNTMTALLESFQLTPGQMALLIKINNNPGISQTALARANGIERSTLGEIIERFEKRSLINRTRHPSDGRAYALQLSEEGETIYNTVVPLIVAKESELTASLTGAEKQTLLGLLRKLSESATTDIEK